jgi:hypothetical protein
VPVPYVVQWEKKGKKNTYKKYIFSLLNLTLVHACRASFLLVPTGALLKYKENRLVVLENSGADPEGYILALLEKERDILVRYGSEDPLPDPYLSLMDPGGPKHTDPDSDQQHC